MRIIQLAQSEDWYSKKTAIFTKDPEILHRILERNNDDWVSRYAAMNPNCPPELLKKILEKGEYGNNICQFAATNPSCPPETLKIILERNNNDGVSQCAANNANCPPKAKLKWLQYTNQIRDYSEEDYNPNGTNNNDLDELEKLLSSSKFNLKKYSQPYDWYDSDVIQRTKDPNLLAEVLEGSTRSNAAWRAAKNPHCPPESLQMVLEKNMDDDVSHMAAENKNCPLEALKMVLERDQDDIVSSYASSNPNCTLELLMMVLDRGDTNRVSRNAANNINCPPAVKLKWLQNTNQIGQYSEEEHNPNKTNNDDLDELENLLSSNKFNLKKYSHEEWFNVDTAKNTTDPDILHKILEKDYSCETVYRAARNENCSPETLHMVLERGKDDYISEFAASNANCYTETLKMVLERKKNNFVSITAAENPNCPPEAKLKWLQETNQIGNYSEEDFSPNETNNDDLDELENLLSSNKFNLKKQSQNEEWYNQKTAEDTTDPEILHRILEKNRNDSVSHCAAHNGYCSPGTLHMVLEKNNSNEDSEFAAHNENCSPETLHMVLERGEGEAGFNFVSEYAVRNKNCSPKTLQMILERGNYDFVDSYASGHPNCPPEARLKWLIDTKQIGKYSEEDFNTNKTNNDDLDELENLLSSNKFNLKKQSQKEEWWYDKEVAKKTKDPDILHKILEKDIQDRTSSLAAKNRNCSPETLRMVLERNHTNCVSISAAYNPTCSTETLRMVLEEKSYLNTSTYATALSNPSCPVDFLTNIIMRKEDDPHFRSVVKNPNCPPELLHMVIKENIAPVPVYYAAKNPNCPLESLLIILERGKDDDISRVVAENPNCPPEAKFRWLQETKQIGQYSEDDYRPNETNNNDLDELENLLSSNKFNLKKHAQNEEWYNEDVAINTTDPEILRNIVEKNILDRVFINAINNTCCPPDAFVMAIERNQDSTAMAGHILWNKSCPPEAIKLILEEHYVPNLEKNENDVSNLINMKNYVAKYAAGHKKCPPEILKTILELSREDSISQIAANNPNCPPKAKLKWLQDTNQIGQYSEEDFNPNETNNNDLDELESLLT